jgi:ribose-phosphate pyrophosphokinase
MKVIIGPASVQLGEKVAFSLKAEAVKVNSKTFPDGENYVRLDGEVKDEDVAIIQTTSPPQDARLIQLAFIADAAKRNGAKKITALVPYLAYARQDKIFLRGESISAETIARMLKASGVEELITINVHQENVLSHFPFPARSLSAIPELADYFVKKGLVGAFALSPDAGAVHIAEEAKKILGGESGYLEKKRDRYTGQVTMKTKSLGIQGRNVIIFDDIISSGGTIVTAAKMLKQLNPKGIYVACVHPLLIGEAEKNILQAGVQEIVGTDSVPSKVSRVSLAGLISRELAT